MDKKITDEIQKLIDETEAEMQKEKSSKKNQSNADKIEAAADALLVPQNSTFKSPLKSAPLEKPLRKRFHPHYGHRGRMKKSADQDPDFTTFSDIETLEYILFNTIPRVDTNEIAHDLIDTFGSFSGVLNAHVAELKTLPYIGEETARMLTSILPVARKAEVSRLRNNTHITNTLSAVAAMQPYFMNRAKEYIYLASLSNNDRLISVDLIASGDTNFTAVEIKKVVETACRHKATKVLIAHNHPAGTLSPSKSDIQLTERIMIALLSVNTILLDHIIFTTDGYYSFYAQGDFDNIYIYSDKIFGTSLVEETRQKRNNFREGIYPAALDEDDDDFSESASVPVYSDDPEKMSYAIGHINPKNFHTKKRKKEV